VRLAIASLIAQLKHAGRSGMHCFLGDLIMEVNHTVAKAAFLQKFQCQVNILWEGRFAATDQDRRKENLAFIDQPVPEGMRGLPTVSCTLC